MDVFLKGVKFEVDDSRSEPPLFILSVRKSGSTMLNKACRQLAHHNNWKFVDVPAAMFANNIPASDWIREPTLKDIVRPGNVYGGFRNFPAGMAAAELFVSGRKVLLVRDPRDALVSEYFSNAYSHRIPAGKGGARARLLAQRKAARHQSIDDYVLKRVPLMKRTLAEYLPLLDDPNTLTVKYEDVIFDKGKMIDRIVGHFGWTCAPDVRKAVIDAIDIIPRQEDRKEFIRKVIPGDHREKLSAHTIERINLDLSDIHAAFGYASALAPSYADSRLPAQRAGSP